jgi:hypothetical protein
MVNKQNKLSQGKGKPLDTTANETDNTRVATKLFASRGLSQ